MLNELIIELDRVALPSKFQVLLHQVLHAGGIWHGRLAVGDITAVPDMIYFLWHDAGDVPVSMLIRRESFDSEEGVRTAASDFLLKWGKRIA